MSARVTTNNHRRPLLCASDLTEAEYSEFDHYVDRDDYSARFVRAYGSVHDVHDVQRIVIRRPGRREVGDWYGDNVDPSSLLASWHGVATDSMWTATVFRLVTDDYGDETAVVGRYIAD